MTSEQKRPLISVIIRLFLREQNMGLGANRAQCVKDCRGEFICNCGAPMRGICVYLILSRCTQSKQGIVRRLVVFIVSYGVQCNFYSVLWGAAQFTVLV